MIHIFLFSLLPLGSSDPNVRSRYNYCATPYYLAFRCSS